MYKPADLMKSARYDSEDLRWIVDLSMDTLIFNSSIITISYDTVKKNRDTKKKDKLLSLLFGPNLSLSYNLGEDKVSLFCSLRFTWH